MLVVTVPPSSEGEGCTACIDNSGGIGFPDYDFDPESEEAAQALGLPRTEQYHFWHEFSSGGLDSLLSDIIYRKPVMDAFGQQGVSAFGTAGAPFTQELLDDAIIEALCDSFAVDSYTNTRNIALYLLNIDRPMRIEESPLEHEDPYFPARDTVCVKRTFFIGERDIATWISCGGRGIDDPVSLEFTDTSEVYMGNSLYLFGYHPSSDTVDEMLRVFEMQYLDKTPEVPKWPVPRSDNDGRWGVAYVNETGQELPRYGADEPRYAPSVDLVTYATKQEAQEAASLSAHVIESGLNLDDWHVFVVKYSGTFGNWGPLEEELPELWRRHHHVLRRETQVLIPWRIVEKVEVVP